MNDLLARVHETGAPVIDADSATFVWEGPHPAQVCSEINRWGRNALPMQELSPGLWTHTMQLSPDAYLEYFYMVGDQRSLDPLNRQIVDNGMGSVNNFLEMPGWVETTLSHITPNVPRGTVTRHIVNGGSSIAGNRRALHLYCPPRPGPWPLLVVYDGSDYLGRALLTTIVDNLIDQNRMRPVAMVLVDNSKQARFLEYDCSDSTLHFLVDSVFPLVRERADILDEPGVHGVLGASMGGLMALYTGLRLPDVFGRVISQSGAFGLDILGRGSVIHTLVRACVEQSIKIYMSVGQYELLIDANKRMNDALRTQGYDVTYREYAAGHNYTAWRNDVPRGLELLFPPSGS